MMLFDEGICATSQALPGGINSSPVPMILILGVPPTDSAPYPAIAAAAIAPACTSAPLHTSLSPSRKSPPWRRICLPITFGPSPLKFIKLPSARASSCTSIVSAPTGTCAPVKMRAACRLPIVPANGAPAALSPTGENGPGKSAKRMA